MSIGQPVTVGMPLVRWREHAACRGGEPEEFFDHQTVGGRVSPEAYEIARRYCSECPVLHRCRREAEAQQEVGLWGGQWRAQTSHGGRTVDLLTRSISDDRRQRRLRR